MRKIKTLSPQQLAAYQDEFEQAAGRTINRQQFRETMLKAAMAYDTWRSKPAGLPADLKTRLQAAYKKSEAAYKATVEFRLILKDAHDAHMWLYPGDDSASAREFRDIIKELDGIEETLEKRIALECPPTGRPCHLWWDASIKYFAFAFWLATGRCATAPYQRRTGDRGGAFVDFVSSVLDKIDPGHNPNTLSNRIEVALRNLRHPNTLDNRIEVAVVRRQTGPGVFDRLYLRPGAQSAAEKSTHGSEGSKCLSGIANHASDPWLKTL